MCPVIENPASCKIGVVIRLLHDKNMSAVVIHCKLCAAYVHYLMSEGTARQWCKIFEDGQTNIHNEE
jgi:hypothetical protein